MVTVKRTLSFKDDTNNEKVWIAMTLLIENVLMRWVNEEQKLHINPLQISWELFEENFITKYLSDEYKHQHNASLHVVQ